MTHCRSSFARPRASFALLALCTLLIGPDRLRAVTITEIHYNPPGADAGQEFVEVHNDSPTVVDLSGWAFTEGIDYVFPRGTFLAGNGYLVLCTNPAAFALAYPGVTVSGAYVGKLDSTGEAIALSNNGGAEVLRVRYRDRGKWPSLPSGTGYTLSLRRPHYDPSEPESWTASAQRGGTPGAANFATASSPGQTELVALGTTWIYKKGTAEFSTPVEAWRSLGFDTAGWLSGTTGIGYGDGDDATDLSADMPNGYMSVAARKTFVLAAAAFNDFQSGTDELILSVNYDDGFVAYLNGTEVARAGLAGDPGTNVAFDAAATSHEAGTEEEFTLPRSALRSGTNVLAIQGHNATLGSTDFSLAPRLLRRKQPSGGGPGAPGSFPLVWNELFGRTTGSRWVELYNLTATEVDLSGFQITDDANDLAKHLLPANTKVPGAGFLVLTEAELGLNFSTPEVRLYLSTPDGEETVLAGIFENTPTDGIPASRTGMSDARFPDGRGSFKFAATPTPGAPNQVAVSTAVVLNEIFYNPPDGNTGGEFLELHNRSGSAVDLGGWSLSNAVDYVFGGGTSIPAGGYLVVAQNPAGLQAAHGITGVLGPWTGSLSNSGENVELLDAVGNIVDEVRYHDGGEWSPWADGGGSSLELVDPRQDNSLPGAWRASDESAKAPWHQVTYSGSYAVEAASEIHFLLIDAGTTLIDDVSLRRTGSATEYIPNPGFETNTSSWLIQGTHLPSARLTSESHSGSACLALTATGGGDNGVNKVEVDTSPVMVAGTYTLSFWTRWIRGSTKLLTRADASTGASLQRMHTLEIPQDLGTPGAENSARAALRLVNPAGNLGPVLGLLRQKPVAPRAADLVNVQVTALDADGISSVSLKYRTGGLGNGVFNSVALLDDGLSGDDRAGDGIYGGQIPAHPTGTKVTFYVEAQDTSGNIGRLPVDAPAQRLLYAVESPVTTPLVVSRVTLDNESEATLTSRLLHSDDLVDATFVYNDEEIYYNVGVRYHGSPWNRPPDPKMYRVRFNEDRPFIRNLKSINLSRYGSSQNEGTAYFCIQSASIPTSPAPSGDYLYSRVYHNTGFHGQMAIVETVDSKYTEKWFPGDGDGYIFKIPGRRYMNDVGGMDGVDWTTLAYRGGTAGAPDQFERYRWYFIPGSNQEENRWADLNAFCSVMDVGRTSTATFDATVESILDVDQFLRVEAARTLQDDWDTIGIGNGQNAYIYFAPNEGRFKLLPWDMDHTFGNTGAKLYPEGAESQITRLIQRPKFRRMYQRIVQQMLGTSWDPAYIGPFLTQTASVTGLSGQGILDFINARRPSVLSIAPTNAVFKLTHIGTTALPANWPGVFWTAKTTERLRGTAPLSVETILVHRNGEPVDVNVTWSSTWSIDVPVGPDENHFELFAFGVQGDLIAAQDFTIVSTVGWLPPVLSSLDPTFGPAAGGTSVRLLGSRFRAGAKVFFGGVAASSVTYTSDSEILATSPPGAAGTVAVRVTNADNQSSELQGAFEYVSALAFIRGDVNSDGVVDIADPVRLLFFLYESLDVSCYDAADVDNSGTLNVTDVIAALSYLFRAGQAPASPFPAPGQDPETPPDALDCQQGL